MASSKDLKAIFKALEDQKFDVVMTRGNHYKIYDPQGRLVTTSAGTPSDYRGIKNFIATLRRAGFIWPHH